MIRRSNRRRNRRAGFTLLELIIVVTIIGILATMLIPAVRENPLRAKEAVLKANLKTLREAIYQYQGELGSYPPSLGTLVDEGFLRALPVDPMTGRDDSWEVVYEEIEEPEEIETDFDFDLEPEEEPPPEPGIVDVYSSSKNLSMDGVTRYDQW